MIKNFFYGALAALTLSTLAFSMDSEEVGIGEEYIQPLRYPKFSASFEYGMMRKFHGMESSKLRADLPNNLGSALSFETGLYKYFNAGGIFSVNFPTKKQNFEPIHLRFTLFAKPYIPLGDRVSIFSRLGGGLSVSFFDYVMTSKKSARSDRANADFYREMNKIYGNQEYTPVPFGINAMATIGIELFPFSRVGLALEWGFRGDFIYARKSSWMSDLELKAVSTTKAPSSLKYLVYEMPLMLTLNVIL